MTYEKALQILNSSFYPQDTVTTEYVNTLAKALKKQIPKKPIVIEDKMWTCPVCGNNLLYKWEKYPIIPKDREYGFPVCLSCFQAIDWSDTE